MTKKRFSMGLVFLSMMLGNSAHGALHRPESAIVVRERVLYESTIWSGDLVVVGPVRVSKTARLTIEPGTRVFFDLPKPPEGSDCQPWLLVLGRVEARGTPEEPVVFAALGKRQNQFENMIDVQAARDAVFKHCVFERGPWGLHLHDTQATIESCVFRDSYGGLRFKGGPVVVRDSRFERNRIGIRCLEASPTLRKNAFVDNLTGIFFRQEVREPVIRENRFANVEYDIKLGEMQTTDVDAAENWWSATEGRLAERIFDGADSEGVGRVQTEPAHLGWREMP
ncbi:MAG: NosD domain-containing protein [Deferrisomatales bacterium]|nr:NosD domain-containing protein [Deferrisomatales bacterium]